MTTKSKSTTIYDSNVCIIKQLGTKVKLSVMKAVKRRGFTESLYNEEFDNSIEGQINYIKKYSIDRSSSSNKEKLQNNISRAKSKIQEYCLCNEWSYFVTITLRNNRKDLEKFKEDLGRFVDLQNKNRGTKMYYLFVPEMHKDGSWHMHGVISGLQQNELKRLDKEFFNLYHGGKMPKYLRMKKDVIYTWTAYEEKFGYCTLEPIRDINKVSSYMRKYISKSLDTTASSVGYNKRLYLASRGLKSAVEIARGRISQCGLDTIESFENSWVALNDYCKSVLADNTDDLKKIIEDEFEKVDFNKLTIVSSKDDFSYHEIHSKGRFLRRSDLLLHKHLYSDEIRTDVWQFTQESWEELVSNSPKISRISQKFSYLV